MEGSRRTALLFIAPAISRSAYQEGRFFMEWQREEVALPIEIRKLLHRRSRVAPAEAVRILLVRGLAEVEGPETLRKQRA
jgi:hypothetical protein